MEMRETSAGGPGSKHPPCAAVPLSKTQNPKMTLCLNLPVEMECPLVLHLFIFFFFLKTLEPHSSVLF